MIDKIKPDEIYFAAQSHVKVSFDVPEYTTEVDALGTLRLLDAIREYGKFNIKFYQASTSELFGKVAEIPQNEKHHLSEESICYSKTLCLLDMC